jgi:hypothetical protein
MIRALVLTDKQRLEHEVVLVLAYCLAYYGSYHDSCVRVTDNMDGVQHAKDSTTEFLAYREIC